MNYPPLCLNENHISFALSVHISEPACHTDMNLVQQKHMCLCCLLSAECCGGRQDFSKNADATLPRKTLWVEVILSVPTPPSTIYPRKEKENLGQIMCCVSGVFLQTIQRKTGVKTHIADNSRAQLSTLVRTSNNLTKHHIKDHLIVLALQFVSCDLKEGFFIYLFIFFTLFSKAETMNLLLLIQKHILLHVFWCTLL